MEHFSFLKCTSNLANDPGIAYIYYFFAQGPYSILNALITFEHPVLLSCFFPNRT